MANRILYFGNPYQLNSKLEQLVITNKDTGEITQAPIEDIAVVIVDHREILLSQHTINKLAENKVAVVFCDDTHHPTSLLLPLDSNQVQTERFRQQIEASLPLKKQLWQHTVKTKIRNQAQVLKLLGKNDEPLRRFATQVLSGDTTNEEAQASRYYWSQLFSEHKIEFRRDRFGMPPNNLLNYGYAILRAAVARALAGSGLLPTLGIHHRNKYNAYCLADDIMEPYRPWVDMTVVDIMKNNPADYHILTKEIKAKLIGIIHKDVNFADKTSPMIVGLSHTTASLSRCFSGEDKTIKFPTLQ